MAHHRAYEPSVSNESSISPILMGDSTLAYLLAQPFRATFKPSEINFPPLDSSGESFWVWVCVCVCWHCLDAMHALHTVYKMQ